MTTTYQIEVKNKGWKIAEKFESKSSGRNAFERYIETSDRPIRFVISRPRAKDGKIEELILREVKKPHKLREERRKVNEAPDDDVARLRERRGADPKTGGEGGRQGAAPRPNVSLGHMVFRMFATKSDLPSVWVLPAQQRILVLFLRACLLAAAAVLAFAAIAAIVVALT